MDYCQRAVGVELLLRPLLGSQMDYCPDVVDAAAHHHLLGRPALRLEQLAQLGRREDVG